MKFTRELSTSLSVKQISERGLVIGNQTYASTVALTPDEIFESWPARDVADLAEEDFDGLLDAATELVLLGTGEKNVFPPRDLVFALARRGIGFEAMDTKAAARTFNVLASEGRKVAAVLYL